jgi:hypothetical protein
MVFAGHIRAFFVQPEGGVVWRNVEQLRAYGSALLHCRPRASSEAIRAYGGVEALPIRAPGPRLQQQARGPPLCAEAHRPEQSRAAPDAFTPVDGAKARSLSTNQAAVGLAP